MASSFAADPRDTIRYWAGRSLGTSLQYATEQDFEESFLAIVDTEQKEWQHEETMMIALNALLNKAPSRIDAAFVEELVDFMCARLEAENMAVQQKAIVTCSLLPFLDEAKDEKFLSPILAALVNNGVSNHLPETRLAALRAISHLAQRCPDVVALQVRSIAPAIMKRTAEPGHIKTAAQAVLRCMHVLLH